MIYFVGIHNKVGKKPLDSSTMTGKVIDAMIEQLNYSECVKTNLCEVEYFPTDKDEIMWSTLAWANKYSPKETDVIVLLGLWVQKNFGFIGAKIIKIGHPAGIFGPKNKAEYISKTLTRIKEAL